MEYLLKTFHPEVIKAFLLSTHYRSPLDYREENIKNMEKAIYRFYETLYWLKKAQPLKEGLLSEKARKLEKGLKDFENNFISALLDDFNTALALGHLFSFENEIYNFITKTPNLTTEEVLLLEKIEKKIKDLSGRILGIGEREPDEFWNTERKRKLNAIKKDLEEIEALVKKRESARKEKNFILADKIRDELKNLGIILKDTRTETFWYVE